METARPALRFAAVVSRSVPGDVRQNLANHERWILRAVAEGAQVVGFPEGSLTGYGGGPGTALPVGSPAVVCLSKLAAEHGIHVLAGLSERAGSHVFSSCVAIGPAGILGVMRKVHCIPEERAVYVPGDRFPVFAVGERRLGVAICADASVYEVPKILALRGAEIVFCPHANGHPALRRDPEAWKAWRLKAWRGWLPDCGVQVVGCNQAAHCGSPADSEQEWGFCGGALMLDPDGTVVAESTTTTATECMVVGELQDRPNPARQLLEGLRPDILYGDKGGWSYGRKRDE